jgi:hypothetical protein
MLMMANRTFLASHARALLCIAHDPEVRLRDIAASRGITERSAYGTVTDPAGPASRSNRRTDAVTAARPGHTCRCRNPAAKSASSATSRPFLPAPTRGRNSAPLDPMDDLGSFQQLRGDGPDRCRDTNRAVSRSVVMHLR